MMKITILSVALAIVAVGLILDCGIAKDYSIDKEACLAIKIYFVPWDIMTRVQLSPVDVRRMRYLYIEINDETMISKIVDAVYNDAFLDRDNTMPEPARLVIDFIKKDGVIETVYANKSHILNQDSSKSKSINNDLLNKIGSLIDLN